MWPTKMNGKASRQGQGRGVVLENEWNVRGIQEKLVPRELADSFKRAFCTGKFPFSVISAVTPFKASRFSFLKKTFFFLATFCTGNLWFYSILASQEKKIGEQPKSVYNPSLLDLPFVDQIRRWWTAFALERDFEGAIIFRQNTRKEESKADASHKSTMSSVRRAIFCDGTADKIDSLNRSLIARIAVTSKWNKF